MKVGLCGVLILLLVAACGQKASRTEQAKSFEAEIAEIKDAREVEKRCTSVDAEYGSADQDVVSIGRKYPIFMVQGNVTDSSEGAVQIFGRAIVDPSRGLSHWASNGNERNIIVINPKNVIHNPSYYVGQHYFIKKDSGKNGFGAEVPVWVFGDPPDDLAAAIQKRMVLRLKLGMCKSRLLALTPPPAMAQPSASLPTEPPPTIKNDSPQNPSFDCAAAVSYVEKEICANQ